VSQAIVVVGGFNSLWPTYLAPARYLEDVSGLPAVAVPLMPWHWWAAGRAGDATLILQKLANTVAWTRRRHRAPRLILVGHSAGGLIARLYLCPGAVWGHTYAGAQHVSHLVTLGSPHGAARAGPDGWYLAAAANRLAPGTPHAPAIHYRTVAGRYLQGRPDGNYRQRQAYRAYRYLGGDGTAWGDGVVPLDCTRLDGAEHLVLDGVSHSLKLGLDRGWYAGSPAVVRRWWPPGAGHDG
jgi:hypothetical protein